MHSSSLMQEPNKSTDGFNLFHLSSPVFTPFLVAKGTSVNKNNPPWSSRAPHGAKPKCESHCPVPPKINQFLQCWCESGYISWPPGMIWSCLPVVSMFASSQNGKAITHNIHAAQRSDSPARLSVMGFFPERVGKVWQWKILGSFVMSFVFVVNKKKVSVQRSARICLGASRRKQDYFECKMQWLTHIYAYIFIYTYMYVCTNANTQKKVSDLFKRKKGVTGKTP